MTFKILFFTDATYITFKYFETCAISHDSMINVGYFSRNASKRTNVNFILLSFLKWAAKLLPFFASQLFSYRNSILKTLMPSEIVITLQGKAKFKVTFKCILQNNRYFFLLKEFKVRGYFWRINFEHKNCPAINKYVFLLIVAFHIKIIGLFFFMN